LCVYKIQERIEEEEETLRLSCKKEINKFPANTQQAFTTFIYFLYSLYSHKTSYRISDQLTLDK